MKKEKGTRNVKLICGQARPGAKLAFLKKMALFCKEFNEKTKERNGELVKVTITVYDDESYQYNIGNIPVIYLLKNRRHDYEELKTKDEKKKAREQERKEVSEEELEKIAQKIITSLNTEDLEKAKKMITSTAKTAGIKIVKAER